MSNLILGKYESMGKLGAGSMGIVYAAKPVADPLSTVAIKVISPRRMNSGKIRQLFDREVRSASRLKHPYIIRLIEAGVDDTIGPCLVMEFAPGETLDQLIVRTDRFYPERVGMLLGYLCHALSEAHSIGIIHGDIKPANLMVLNPNTENEFIKVMDFGLSTASDKPHYDKDRLERGDSLYAQGTPAYISPEMLRGDSLTNRADLYSVGIILFELLTGRHPFPYEHIDDVMHAHLNEEPPRFADVGVTDIDPAIEAVVRRCLAKYIPERYESASALAIAYSQALDFDIWQATMPVREENPYLPVAEAVEEGPIIADKDGLVGQLEAWMPDQIATVKLGGFIDDIGGKINETGDGFIRIKIGEEQKKKTSFIDRILKKPTPAKRHAIDLELKLRRTSPGDSQLEITAIFSPIPGREPEEPSEWNRECETLFNRLRSFVM